MKDGIDMTKLTQGEFKAAKAILDKTIDRVGRLADDAFTASKECCGLDLLDARDDFGMVAAELMAAQAHLARARAFAGRVAVPERITRDGGT